MDYSFNVEIAKRYGLDEAVFLHNLYFWILKNEANGRHFYEGRSWTYNSGDALCRLFPFWNKKQIYRLIAKLKEAGAIYVGNFNENKMDRTAWYALGEEVLEIYEGRDKKVEMQVPKTGNGSTESGTAIPDNKPTDSKHIYPPVISKDITSPQGEKRKFEPPTVEEVQAYVEEKGWSVKAEEFIAYYQARGWKFNGNVAMKDWRATVLRWELRERKTVTSPPKKQSGGIMEDYERMNAIIEGGIYDEIDPTRRE